MKSRIIDCITFFDNNFMFEIRYNVLKDFVDFFLLYVNLNTITEINKKKKFCKSRLFQ